jgi:hypothetical protein
LQIIFAITASVAKVKWSTNLMTSQLMCNFWSNSIIICSLYFKRMQLWNFPLRRHQVPSFWQVKKVIVFKHNIGDFIISCNLIQYKAHLSFAIGPCFRSKAFGRMICLSFPSKALVETNKFAWGHLTIKGAYICVSFPHVKACVTLICQPNLPSLICIHYTTTFKQRLTWNCWKGCTAMDSQLLKVIAMDPYSC